MGYGLPKWSAKLNHLAYADDTIIFASVNRYSLKRIMLILQEYEVQSDKKVNKEKSAFYLHQSAGAADKELVEECVGISEGHFTLKYLSVPITHSRKRKEHYEELIKKVKAKLQFWKANMLSYEGKEVLITNVLQSVPIHVLSAIVPSICVIK